MSYYIFIDKTWRNVESSTYDEYEGPKAYDGWHQSNPIWIRGFKAMETIKQTGTYGQAFWIRVKFICGTIQDVYFQRGKQSTDQILDAINEMIPMQYTSKANWDAQKAIEIDLPNNYESLKAYTIKIRNAINAIIAENERLLKINSEIKDRVS